jgi:AcrR family transcriptional regulator
MPKKPKEIRIEQILDAALDEFLAKGFDGATMESVARRAGLTKGGIYHHFRSKDEILVAVNHQFQKQVELFQDAARNQPNAFHGLQGFIRDYIGFWADHPRETMFIFLSMAKLLAVPEYWTALREYYEESRKFFEDLLDHAVRQRELRAHDTPARAVAIMAALDGITPMLVTGNESGGEVIAQLFAALLGDLAISGKPLHP